VTEDEWLACTDPILMLQFARPRMSLRRLRLFYCAFLRFLSATQKFALADEVTTAEEYADRRVSRAVMETARENVRQMRQQSEEAQALIDRDWVISGLTEAVCQEFPGGRILIDLRDYARSVGMVLEESFWSGVRALLADVVGNPFREVRPDPAWLAWNDRMVVKIAQGIYDERAFDRMPILHDALLHAGCDDEALLSHCRNPAGHVRGCWAIGTILGKQ
jgi:hypothetical protein